MSIQTLGVVFAETLPGTVAPSTVEEFAKVSGPGLTTLNTWARDLTVCGSEVTLKLLLVNGVEANYEAALSDYPKKSNGKPLPFRRISDAAARLAKASICTGERHHAAISAERQSRDGEAKISSSE